VTVLLDNACFKGSLPYPSIKSLSARSYVGGRHDPAAPGSMGGAVHWGTGLRGRVGAVYLLDEYLKEEPLRALHARGPDYSSSSSSSSSCSSSSGSGGDGSGSALDPAWEGSLLSTSRVMLLLHPARLRSWSSSSADAATAAAAMGFQQEVEESGQLGGSASFLEAPWDWRGRPVLEMVRAETPPQQQMQQPALLGQGVVAVARTSVVDALDCVGGAKVSSWCCSNGRCSDAFDH
jgi:hypothetical protein